MQMRRVIPLLAVAVLGAAPLSAQVAWDAPMLVAPTNPIGWGGYLVDPAPGDGVGFMATLRSSQSVGYRAGIAESAGDNLAVFGGVDFSGPMLTADSDFPLDIDWLLGAGVGIGDFVIVSAPIGLTMGRRLVSEDLALTPYVSPRLVMDAALGDDGGGDDLNLDFAFDVGLDIAPSSSWTIRFGGTIGDREALAIGVNIQR